MIEGAIIFIIGYILGLGAMYYHKAITAEVKAEADKPKPFDDYRDPKTGRLKRPKKG